MDIVSCIKEGVLPYGANPSMIGYYHNLIYSLDLNYSVESIEGHTVMYCDKKQNAIKGKPFFLLPLPDHKDTPLENTINLVRKLFNERGWAFQSEVLNSEVVNALKRTDMIFEKKKEFSLITDFTNIDFELKGKKHQNTRNEISKAEKQWIMFESFWAKDTRDSSELFEHYNLWRKQYKSINGKYPRKRSNINTLYENLDKLPDVLVNTARDRDGKLLFSAITVFYCGVDSGYNCNILFHLTENERGEKIGSRAAKYMMFKSIKEVTEKAGGIVKLHDGGGGNEIDGLAKHKMIVGYQKVDNTLFESYKKKSLFD